MQVVLFCHLLCGSVLLIIYKLFVHSYKVGKMIIKLKCRVVFIYEEQIIRILLQNEIRGENMLALYMAMVDTDEERSLVEQLYTSYEQMMYKAAFSVLKDSYYAEDAVHEAFLRIIRNMSCLNFDDDKKTRALLVITVRNVCFNMLRRNKRMPVIDEPEEETEDISAKEEYLKLEAPSAAELIKQLPDEIREVIVMRFIRGDDAKTTADILGISVPTVYSRIRRAREIIKEFIEEEYND